MSVFYFPKQSAEGAAARSLGRKGLLKNPFFAGLFMPGRGA